ncbi:hypothetical protein CHS0354_012293 [Potamilus streckersoni]|uniref:Uncharacterized protein n=1 Tax=Potamilus streckersoni TaxID=2493646 RepID=A0AAE0SFH2_9BIVA|nr:hypothetical protein CHS0354_012293 [Potamilus streckersoni]
MIKTNRKKTKTQNNNNNKKKKKQTKDVCTGAIRLSIMLSRTHIEEANKHLHALHNRVNSLERSLKEHKQIVASKDETLKAHISELKSKDLELIQYKEKIHTLELQQKKFEDILRQKNAEIDRLQKCDTAVKSMKNLVPNLQKLMLDIQEALQIDNESYVNSGSFENTAESEINDGQDGGDYSEKSRVSEMAKKFVREHYTKHFSISEDDEEEEEGKNERQNSDLNYSDSKSQQVESVIAMTGKEFYL